MGFIRDVNVMRMRQRRTLPGSKFFLHRLLLFPITLPCHSPHYLCPPNHRRLARPTLASTPACGVHADLRPPLRETDNRE
jgi:hypothetical protein